MIQHGYSKNPKVYHTFNALKSGNYDKNSKVPAHTIRPPSKN